jgi:hypothetical protein
MELKPPQWTQVQYEMFFDALKQHGPNFTKIGEAIGSNRFIVGTFFKRYQQVNNVKSEPPQRPEWTEEDKNKILQVAEQYGEDWDRMVAAVGNKSRRSVMKKVGRVKDRFDAKETLNDWEQKMILAINKPKTVTATTTQIEKEIEAEKPATDEKL